MGRHGAFPETRLQPFTSLHLHIGITCWTQWPIQHACLGDGCRKKQIFQKILSPMLRMVVIESVVTHADEYSTRIHLAGSFCISQVRGPYHHFVSICFKYEANFATLAMVRRFQSLANVFRPQLWSRHFSEISFQDTSFEAIKCSFVRQHLLRHLALLCVGFSPWVQ